MLLKLSAFMNTGFLTTIFGRRRQFPHITHSAHHMRAQAERQAVNFCVQGKKQTSEKYSSTRISKLDARLVSRD